MIVTHPFDFLIMVLYMVTQTFFELLQFISLINSSTIKIQFTLKLSFVMKKFKEEVCKLLIKMRFVDFISKSEHGVHIITANSILITEY